jgi:hypothetical protein
VGNRVAGILTLTAFALCFQLFGAVSEVADLNGSLYILPLFKTVSVSLQLRGCKGKKTGLWWRENLPHDPILQSISEKLPL